MIDLLEHASPPHGLLGPFDVGARNAPDVMSMHGYGLHLAQKRQDTVQVTSRHKRRAQVEPEIDGGLGRALLLGGEAVDARRQMTGRIAQRRMWGYGGMRRGCLPGQRCGALRT